MWLVIGGSGYLGSYVQRKILSMTNDQIICTYCTSLPNVTNERVQWSQLDVTNRDQVTELGQDLVDAGRKLQVLILSAVHHPDQVERSFTRAAEVNIIGLTNLLNILPDMASVWYVSSDVVYGESINKHFFHEDEPTKPLNAYGRQKSVAEQIVLAYGHNVVRCSFLIGPSLIQRPHFYDQIVDSLKRGSTLKLLIDQRRSTIDFDQAAELLTKLAIKFTGDNVGIVNIGADQPLSKLEVGIKIAKTHNLSDLPLVGVRFSESDIFTNRRARDIILNNDKIKRLLGLERIICSI